MRIFEREDVMSLLRSEIKKAGGQTAWSRKTGVHRTTVVKVLMGLQPITKSIIRALKLRVVFVAESKSPHSE
jgi:DNA-binding phage protein